MTIDAALRDTGRDAGLALRMLRRRPGFAAVALLTLALGIGAPTAIFSVVDAVLLRPLPYPEPDRVVRFHIDAQTPAGPLSFDAMPVEAALAWSAKASTLQALALFNDRALTLSTADGPFRLTGTSATPQLFDLLGATPAIGRTFSGAVTDTRQIVLSAAMWQHYFKADPSVVGSTITLDGDAYRVTGVMPAGFGFPTPETLFWVPQILDAGQGRGMLLPAVARLRPGATVAAAEDEGLLFLRSSDDARVQQELRALTLQEQMVGGIRRVLWVLMAAVSLVSVIATVNIALLLLTRGASRAREFAIRLALGAGRGRLARQLFIEGITLAVLGGVAGMGLAAIGLQLLMRLAPADLPRLQETAIDGRVLLLAVAITLLASVVFGLLSAGRVLAVDTLRRLTGGDTLRRLTGPAAELRLVVAGPARRNLHTLASVELAVTMVLLVGAGLLLRSFVSLVMVPQGFEPRGALAFSLSLPQTRYPTAAARLAFLDRVHTQVAQLTGVKAAGLAAEMPNRQPTGRFEFSSTGVELFPDPMTRPTVETRMVSDGFIEAMGIPLKSGRTFAATDDAGAEPVIVISEIFARQQFKDRDPIGHTLYSESGNRRVVGVVGDIRPAAEGAEMKAAVYLPLKQEADLLSWHSGMNVVVRGSAASSLAAPVRALVLSLDPDMPPANVRTLSSEVSNLVAGPRFSATVLGIFAVVALVMASIGVYGVMAYAAGQRTREIGVRVALGASRRQILRLMMRDGVRVVLAGTVVGLVAAVWLARALTALLHEVTPADPIALISVGVLLSVAGLVAAYVPARRATRLNVLTALRAD